VALAGDPATASGRAFPDSRDVVDPSRREIADAIRAEIDAGRIRHDTPVLHVDHHRRHRDVDRALHHMPE
jgi:hypothetical protein